MQSPKAIASRNLRVEELEGGGLGVTKNSHLLSAPSKCNTLVRVPISLMNPVSCSASGVRLQARNRFGSRKQMNHFFQMGILFFF